MRETEYRPRKKKGFPPLAIAGVVVGLIAAVLIAGYVMKAKEESYPDLQDYLKSNQIRLINDPVLVGKKFKGYGVVREVGTGVDQVRLIVALSDGGGVDLVWNRDNGPWPAEGQRIDFVCEFYRTKTIEPDRDKSGNVVGREVEINRARLLTWRQRGN